MNTYEILHILNQGEKHAQVHEVNQVMCYNSIVSEYCSFLGTMHITWAVYNIYMHKTCQIKSHAQLSLLTGVQKIPSW